MKQYNYLCNLILVSALVGNPLVYAFDPEDPASQACEENKSNLASQQISADSNQEIELLKKELAEQKSKYDAIFQMFNKKIENQTKKHQEENKELQEENKELQEELRLDREGNYDAHEKFEKKHQEKIDVLNKKHEEELDKEFAQNLQFSLQIEENEKRIKLLNDDYNALQTQAKLKTVKVANASVKIALNLRKRLLKIIYDNPEIIIVKFAPKEAKNRINFNDARIEQNNLYSIGIKNISSEINYDYCVNDIINERSDDLSKIVYKELMQNIKIKFSKLYMLINNHKPLAYTSLFRNGPGKPLCEEYKNLFATKFPFEFSNISRSVEKYNRLMIEIAACIREENNLKMTDEIVKEYVDRMKN